VDAILHEQIVALVDAARAEDGGGRDVTSDLLADPSAPAVFDVIVESPGVLAGQVLVEPILRAYAEEGAISHEWSPGVKDGSVIEAGPTCVLTLRGPMGLVLTVERVLLNFLQRLCGIATKTRQFVDAIEGTRAKILDTRKTTPGWRMLEKYAVRCGGGINHRIGLHDAVLIKDNHLYGIEPGRIASAVFEMLNKLQASDNPPKFVEVEADSLDQVEQLLKIVGIDVILLDNFTIDQLAEAVALREREGLADSMSFEASGGLTLDTVAAIAATGVERISVGAITHSAPALSMKLERVQ